MTRFSWNKVLEEELRPSHSVTATLELQVDEFGCCVGTCTLGLARSRRKSVLSTEGVAWLVRVAGAQLPWSHSSTNSRWIPGGE
jgi:hypothetical protein